MPLEVEQKFRCDDLLALRRRALELGAERCGSDEHRDRYFNHPSRDFAATDEAFRLRQVGPRNYLTYKGPKLDAATKTRLEYEVALADGAEAATAATAILGQLGFRYVAEVVKRRETLRLPLPEGVVELALDQVDGLGTFAELELCVNDDNADPSGSSALQTARALLAETAHCLSLSDIERRSYLELLLAGP